MNMTSWMRLRGLAGIAAAVIVALAVGGLFARAGNAGEAPAPTAGQVAPTPGPLPTGAYGALVRYGREIISDTRKTMPGYVTAANSCEACHISAGTKPHGGSLVGIYGEFPQWNKRSKRFISLQDRLAECFLYSMNGRPPAYTSREMEALVAYIAFLSKGQPVGTAPKDDAYEQFNPDHKPNPRAGAVVYAQRCSACHGADGAGHAGAFPPLWGSKSFNDGAGMHRINTMAEFVRYNMPYGSPPNTLTKQEAYDVAAFVLTHARPRFNPNRVISFPPRPAGFF